MDTIRQDIRFAFRTLARKPAYTIVAALTLALGIGATTAIYSVVDAVLLSPLPWPDSDRLVQVHSARGENQTMGVVYLDFKDWQSGSTTFEDLGVVRGQSVNLTGGEVPERIVGNFVTASTLRLLGARPLMGRLFTDAETEVATKEPNAIITEALWRSRFGERADIVGSSLTLNGQPFVVVGVLPASFTLPIFSPDVYLPVGYYPNRGDLDQRGRAGVWVFGRMKPGVTIASAKNDLGAIARRISEAHPATNAELGVNVRELREVIVGEARKPLFVVLGSVATVLLIACANVANLQLARAAARRRELSVRAALGAGRRRLMRQLLTESAALSLLGGVLGMAIAYAGVRWFAAAVPAQLPVVSGIELDAGVLAFAAAITMATGLLFGLAPAWRATRVRLQESLTVRSDTGGTRLRAHHVLVMGQISLCVVLLVGAALLTRSLMALARVEPGFEPSGVLTMQFRVPPTRYDTEAKIADMFARSIAEIRTVPGVASAALVRATPLNGNGELLGYEIEGAGSDPAQMPRAHRNIVSSDYFATLEIPRFAGRDFNDADGPNAMPVAIVNRQLARRLAADGNAIGKRLRVTDGDSLSWLTVVGVVGDARHFALNEDQLDQIYVPFRQKPLIFTEVVIRPASGDAMSVANAAREAIWRVDREQPVWGVRALTESISRQLGDRRFMMRLLASFAVLAVVLAVIGVYGVMSYAVARRTQEMGVRMALGAQSRQVVRLVLRQGAATIVSAIAIGTAAAYVLSRTIESQLYGIGRTDPVTYAAVPLALAAVALIACYIPARRASRVDPVIALRSD